LFTSHSPNHKGKTYEEIYGIEEAKNQKVKRNAAQIAVGGYGPKHHSEDSKVKMKEAAKHKPPYTIERLEKMSKSMIGKNTGKTYSTDVNKSKGRSGENNGMFGRKHKKYKCKYCNKEMALHLLNRWHNENCKLKNI